MIHPGPLHALLRVFRYKIFRQGAQGLVLIKQRLGQLSKEARQLGIELGNHDRVDSIPLQRLMGFDAADAQPSHLSQ
ncbi:hypothetical protein PPOLYM_05430 [Paenibacillus polymyxa]|nr:hypothetical protein PPOLYM_05430 [Paenibacillus polymyxa]